LRRDGKLLPFPTPGKIGGHPIRAGDALLLQSAGGGGYGDPLERDPEVVADDAEEGYVSAETAYTIYGVVVTDEGTADAEATAARRAAIRAGRLHLTVERSDLSGYAENGPSRRRICRLNPIDAEKLGLVEGAMLELVPTTGAALRAWTRIDTDVGAGRLLLDEQGIAILGAPPGSRVQVRRLTSPGAH
jgi:N-methylhydantoinase B